MPISQKEFAPGIPFPTVSSEKIDKAENEVFEFVIQQHDAERARRHYDLRLGDPKTGKGYSWALRYLPEPGEVRLAVPQPIHSIEYFNWEGVIPEGYGKGKVKILDRDQAHVLYAGPDKIRFNLYKGKEVHEYSLIKTKTGWLLVNQTDTRKDLPDIPDYKPKFKEIPIEKIDDLINDPSYIMQRKDDGVHIIYHIKNNGNVKLFSPKVAATKSELIDHTYKVPHFIDLKIPSLKNSIFRGELFLIDKKTGKAASIRDVVSFANSNTWSAFNLLDRYEPRTTIFDIVQLKGKNIENEPYFNKFSIIQNIIEKNNFPAEIPHYAISADKKRQLLEDLKRGRIPETREGVVFQKLDVPQRPIKSKFVKEYDVYIREITPGKGSLRGIGAGGFSYSLTPDGPIVGEVGTGFSLQERIDMWKNPEEYIGKVAKIKSTEQFPSGAFRIPTFVSLHYEKSL